MVPTSHYAGISGQAPRVAIVGAGLSGLMAATVLQDHGLESAVFDKGRRPGGRANTREHGQYRFDHGAQYFTVRDPLIRPYLESWLQDGVVSEWNGRLLMFGDDGPHPARAATRYVGTPGMIAIAQHLSRNLDVRCGLRVESVERGASGDWTLVAGGDQYGGFGRVIIATPAAQAVPLLAGSPQLQEDADRAEMEPCWVGMFIFEQSLALPFDGAFVRNGPLAWMARNSSKAGRPNAESWVLHATPEWTRAHLDADPNHVTALLLQAVAEQFLEPPNPSFARAHRWGFASTDHSVRDGSLFDAELGLGACGDWCSGGRVEGALLSGISLAERILAGGFSRSH